ncbi:MAG TPA: LysE family transporter [Candidatus Eremiobacteraceae bacterium]|nr:LysE family transporter [Candidatus Eremiobacteraceae bacterium]
MLTVFAQGFAVGFLIAAPIGPIGLLCIRRSLEGGWQLGFASGLGAAFADAYYAAIAAFGLSAAFRFLQSHARAFQVVAILLLGALAVQAFRSAFHAPREVQATKSHIAGATASTFLLTIVNPTTIVSFAAAFTIIATRVGPLSALSAALFVLGAFCGSTAWWLILSSAVSALRARVRPAALRWVNAASGVGLLAFGVWVLLRAP